ncbi:MAG: hypothetical protein ABIS20_23880 [Thermoanaerobaculia bacterium]
MADQDQDKKALGIENLEVSELEEQDLEEVAGGGGGITNGNCPCGPQDPK